MPGKRRNKRKPSQSRRNRGRGRVQVPGRIFAQTTSQWVTLGGWYEVPTDGAGSIAGVVPSDPTLINNGTIHPEYASWQTLYSEIKVVNLKCTFFPRFAESKSISTDGTPLAIAGSLNVTSTPTSLDTVLDNASSKCWNFLNDASAQGFTFMLNWTDLKYAAAASPGGITDAGTPGGIGFYGLGYAASTFGVFIRYRVVYLMRNRI